MSEATKPPRDYSTMTREEAVRHFSNRELELKEEIRSLPLSEKFRLVAQLLEAGDAVVPALSLSVARLAMAELEARR